MPGLRLSTATKVQATGYSEMPDKSDRAKCNSTRGLLHTPDNNNQSERK